ncbi:MULTISPECIES: helix-turn-helix domain-containing protein [Bacillus]|uniref:helix-turn-helix domain-containing protein n=1 Tax=Bacillus TaxID=1386 RepID=UPI000F7A7F24|nr:MULTISPECIES: AraC family transcriptional regulator [Bacillus]MDJ0288373.1 AraC family transcriptional regulator [Bacillus altitudinis]
MMYSRVTQEVISYLESHLMDELSLKQVHEKVGYSQFHLLRVFKRETGLSMGEYVRKRRLATAAQLLLYTDQGILDIAFSLQFQSQEAFTRAFKHLYSLPPGMYRSMMRDMQMKKEEDSMTLHEAVPGWGLSGSHPHMYEMGVDTAEFHTGKQSGVLSSKEGVQEGQFATMMQGFQAKEYVGKRLKLSAFLKTENVSSAGIWMRVDDGKGDTVQFDNMQNRPVTDSTEWNQYAIVLDIPTRSESIHFGVLLSGHGTVWADGFRFEEVDEKTPTTNMEEASALPDVPMNLHFELEKTV